MFLHTWGSSRVAFLCSEDLGRGCFNFRAILELGKYGIVADLKISRAQHEIFWFAVPASLPEYDILLGIFHQFKLQLSCAVVAQWLYVA